MDWPEASEPPNNNIVGTDPQLVDPENGDYRPDAGSPAAAYGCQTFPARGCPLREQVRPEDRIDLDWIDLGQSADAWSGGRRPGIICSGAIETDEVWDADTVLVVGNVTIEEAVTLTIVPGTRVEFSDFYRMEVLGRLLAVGTAAEPITFTTDEPWAFVPDSTRTGCWNGIRFPWTPAASGESRLEHCVLEYSKALGDEPWGGAISTDGFSDLLVRNCILRSNAASYGGAVFCSNQAAPVIAGTLMEGNSAFLRGSAVYCLYSYPDITNCTIVSNSCLNDEAFDETGAIHCHISKPRTTNSIVRDNISAYFIPTQILRGKAFYTTYSNIEDGHDGEGNIDKLPLFMGSGDHPFALLDGSPCVNAGRPDTSGLRLPPVDLAGSVRVDDGTIDIGCYEGPAWTGVSGGDAGSQQELFLTAPNPLRGPASLSLTTPGGLVSVRIYDLAGRRVRTLLEGAIAPGEHTLTWDCRDGAGRRVAAGVYFCRAELEGAGTSVKLVLLK